MEQIVFLLETRRRGGGNYAVESIHRTRDGAEQAEAKFIDENRDTGTWYTKVTTKALKN